MDDARDDQHDDADDQRRREELADDVDDARLAACQQVDDDEEHDGKRDEVSGRRIAEVGGDGELEGRRCRARHGKEHAQAKNRRRAKRGSAHLAERLVEGVARTAGRVHDEHAEARQHRVGDEKADEAPYPQVAAFLAERGREDEVARAEEHREQGKPDDDRVLAQGYVALLPHAVRSRVSPLLPMSF